MLPRGLIVPIVLAAALCLTIADARANGALYPAWSGGWTRVRDGKHGNWDPEKPRGLGQQAPLTPGGISPGTAERNLADQELEDRARTPATAARPMACRAS